MTTHQWNARLYDSRHSYVFQYGEDVLKLLAPQAGERILDLGCGTGHLTRKIADAGASVIGIDRAETMIEQARQNYPELRFLVADATDFTFDEPFDAVFSNAVLHWIPAAEDVAACIWRALKPGGRFVAEFGGKSNIQAVETAVYAALQTLGHPDLRLPPYYFPSTGEYTTLLERQGFRVTFAAHFDRPTPVDGEDGLQSWLEMYLNNIVSALPEATRAPFFRQVEVRLRPTQYHDGTWYIDYVRLRVVAIKEYPARHAR
jgi:trans-aconitate methyltransferase